MAEAANSGKTKQIIFLVVIVLIVAVAAAGFIAKGRKAGHTKVIQTGDQAPDFRLSSLDGRQIRLADLRGKVVMVHFWATWCPPCVEEIPNLAKLPGELGSGDFEMLLVSVDDGGAGAVAPFMQKKGINLPVLLDPDRSTAALYGTFKFPETYILDRQGTVRFKVIGPGNWTDPAAVRTLQEFIASK